MLALEEIKEKGGVLKRAVEVIIEDDEGNPDKCLSAAKKLVELDKVDLLTGVLHSGNVVAISEYVSSVGIPYISPISSGPVLVYTQNPQKFRNFFTIHPYYDDVAKLGLKFLTDVVNAKTYMYIGEALTFSVRSGEFLKVFAADRKINCLGEIIMPAGSKDFSEAIMKVKEAKPDAVIINIFSGAEVTLARQIYENRLPVPYFAIMASLSMWETAELLGDASDYLAFGTWSWNVSLTEKTVPFFNKFYKKYGYRACGLEGPAGYDLMYFVAAAVEKAGTLEWNAIIKAYETVEIVGVRGITKIDPSDHGAIYWAPGYINGVLAQWMGRKPYVIWPPEMAEKSYMKAPWMG
jgi:branched-chain amino acid transport system substrate-binding protein